MGNNYNPKKEYSNNQEMTINDFYEKLSQKIHGLEVSMKQDMGSFKQEMGSFKQEMGSFRQDMGSKIDKLSARIELTDLIAKQAFYQNNIPNIYSPKEEDEIQALFDKNSGLLPNVRY